MSDPWVKTIRRSSQLIEHICSHGVGHPVRASADWMAMSNRDPRGNDNPWLSHGCDGCCQTTEWKVASMEQSIEKANDIIFGQRQLITRLNRELREKENP